MSDHRTYTQIAKDILAREYGSSRNFMTPTRVTVGLIAPTIAYELSRGSGFEPGTELWGVSVAGITPGGATYRRGDLSGCFRTRAQAQDHIISLIEAAKLETADA